MTDYELAYLVHEAEKAERKVDDKLADLIATIAHSHPGWNYYKITAYIRRTTGQPFTIARVRRVGEQPWLQTLATS